MLPHEYNHYQIIFSPVNITSGIKNSRLIAPMVLIHVECSVFHFSFFMLYVGCDARTTRTAQLSVVLSSSVLIRHTKHCVT